MKLLLTSGGVTSLSIRAALVELLSKPIEESHALDEHRAITVRDGAVDVVSEGRWVRFAT